MKHLQKKTFKKWKSLKIQNSKHNGIVRVVKNIMLGNKSNIVLIVMIVGLEIFQELKSDSKKTILTIYFLLISNVIIILINTK